MKNPPDFTSSPNETKDARITMTPRQKPPRTAHPDLHHLISSEGYFRTRRQHFVAETDEQKGLAAE
ncbi:MAG TPA: hypothetical protein VLA64_12945 [Azonexus sp.]|nr:hypothetical protein [Azonexus sp.]